ncbi:hypothetical protein [Pseudoalteromonas rubra]|uniref:hypothetical protein n=1 Tax=Pseudoalteromonas rubra TaxID=43658 RepID=UPI002DB60686|nr:hypothetical protein [Pseudoalteromonas rubra]MEC4088266.1 hypothetical protein [Pseudoalteromonas rubra]
MKKIVLPLLLLTSLKAVSGVMFSTPYLSFINLILSSEDYKGKEVKVSGYFMNTGEGNFLCMTMEACYTRSKERIRVRDLDDEKASKIDKCHVSLEGKYLPLDSTAQGHWPIIGFIDVTKDYSYSFINGYESVNSACGIYEEFKKLKYPHIDEEKL